LVNVSTRAIHNFVVTGGNPNYTLSKNAGTLLLQQIAKDISPEKMQIISFHPGTIFTDAARDAGYNENSLAWNNGKSTVNVVLWRTLTPFHAVRMFLSSSLPFVLNFKFCLVLERK
jgi:NAD(P)-dependent dehydrogenase (short-subunit alcohol dehydrogenase family)